MSLYQLKPTFQRVLNPLTTGLHRAGATPNVVTVAAIALSVAIAMAIPIAYRAWGPWVFVALPAAQLLRMALNAMDGEIARRFSMQSTRGAVLNEVGDVLNGGLFLWPFLFVKGIGWAPVVALLFVSALIEFVGVLSWAVGGLRRYDGPLGKADLALASSGIALWVASGLPLSPFVDPVLWGLVALGVFTVLRRGKYAAEERAS